MRDPPAEPVDILALKKQVLEEVRRELAEEAKEREEREERARKALEAQRKRDLEKEEAKTAGEIFPHS